MRGDYAPERSRKGDSNEAGILFLASKCPARLCRQHRL
jgi:hypothetical protein